MTNYVTTPEHLHDVVDHFSANKAMSFDVETYTDNRGVPSQAPVSWLSIATDGMCVAIPMGHPNGSYLIEPAHRRKNKETGGWDSTPAVWTAPPIQMKPSQVWSIVKPLFMSDIIKVAQSATFDLISTAKYFGNKTVPGPYADTIVMQWLLNENMKQKGLKEMVRKYYGVDYDKEGVGKCVESWGYGKVARYAYLDAKFTYLLWKDFGPRLVADNLTQVYDLEMRLLPVLCAMNLQGVDIDMKELLALKKDLSGELVMHEAAVYNAAGQRFNINSNPQKVHLLFGPKDEGCQGLKPREFSAKTQIPSTDVKALSYFPRNALVNELGKYAEVSKLLNTYVIGYLGDKEDKKKPCRIYNGKIHTDLVQYGTVTGRLSSRSPSLHTVPGAGTEHSGRIRGLFVSPPHESFIRADYGQIEVVVLAHFSKAKALVDGFNAGIDAHTLTASKVYHVDVADVTKPMRQTAKGLSFATIYGAGPDKVADMASITLMAAKGFLKVHQQEFPEVYAFKEAVIRVAKSRRPAHIRTLLGRKRRLPTLFSPDKGVRMRAERQAVNALVQGSAADIIKVAMIRLHESLPPQMHLILSIHDELVMTCPDAEVEEGSRLLREAMTGEGISSLLSVPMTIDLTVAKRWADVKG